MRFVAVVALALPLAGSAHASDGLESEDARFGRRDAFVFAIEQAFGFTREVARRSTSAERHDGFGVAPGLGPRLAFHATFASGASVGVVTSLWKRFDDDADLRGLAALVGPRFGFVAPIGDRFAVWPRAGFTLLLGGPIRSAGFQFDVTADLLAVAKISRYVGLSFGPTASYGLIGERVRYDALGVHLGLLGDF